MALTRGRFLGYEFDRMVMLFSMVDGKRGIPCAISTSAMDDLEGVARSMPNQREAQFVRLRDRIEEGAARKFWEGRSTDILEDLSCVVSTSKLSPKGMPNAISAFHREHIVLWLCSKMTWPVRKAASFDRPRSYAAKTQRDRK